jgi:maltooligosyltrehalose trehalohydrolase
VEFRKRKHGVSSANVSGEKFVVFSQNHDQIGNRMLGERNSVLISFEGLKLAAAIVLLSPYIPLLFMGEEYAEDHPFLYFISHMDDNLIRLVREGRKKDFERFNFEGRPFDPQSEETFNKSKLDWQKKEHGKNRTMFLWYKELIRIRKSYTVFTDFDKKNIEATIPREDIICMKRKGDHEELICLFNLSEETIDTTELMNGSWKKILDSNEFRSQEEYDRRNYEEKYLSAWNLKVYLNLLS